jgi:hypothetical protein
MNFDQFKTTAIASEGLNHAKSHLDDNNLVLMVQKLSAKVTAKGQISFRSL